MSVSKETKAFKREVMSGTFAATILAVMIGIWVAPKVEGFTRPYRDQIGM